MLKFDADIAAKLDRAYRGRDFVRRRHANLAALAPKAGDDVLDLGCGSGILLQELANAVGDGGTATGVDPSPDMLAAARTASADCPNARLVEGTADALPFADASFDAIVSVQVFEYLDDLAQALAECARVLRPGGRLVIGDMLFDTLAWRSDDPARMARIVASWDGHFAERNLPARLPAAMAAAGLVHEASIPVTMLDHGPRPDGLARMMQILMTDFAHRSGAVSEAEALAWSDELDRLSDEGRYFFSLTHVVTAARRH